ncbi:hypothetical protein FRC00_001285 [Tulasnella sp. 408]|nr:hypothetical protein FRC00_001285 [Tulasnella sp. 408]
MSPRRIHFTAHNTVFIDDERFRILGSNYNDRGNQYYALDYEFFSANRDSPPPTGGPFFYFNQDGKFYFDDGRGRRLITSHFDTTWEEEDGSHFDTTWEEEDGSHFDTTWEEEDGSHYSEALEDGGQSHYNETLEEDNRFHCGKTSEIDCFDY